MCVVWGSSNKPSQDISTLFKQISSDNEIAEKFKIGWTNLMYINNFGLALYFKELPYSKIKVSNWFVILYDESLNKITQQCLLWFWDEEKNRVDAYYLTAKFLGHFSTSDFVHLFEHCEIDLFVY